MKPRLPLEIELAWRFARGRRSGLLAGTARAALVGAGLGVASLVIAMALMTGYSEDLRTKLLGGNATVGIFPLDDPQAGLSPAELEQLAALPGVTGLGHVLYRQGLLGRGLSAAGAVDVTLRGVDPGADRRATPDQLASGPDGVPGAVLGADLARRLGVTAGERVVLTAFEAPAGGRPRFRFQSLRVAGTFESGFAEFDQSWALIDRQALWRIASAGPRAFYELALRDPASAPGITDTVRGLLGERFGVSDWRDLNRELFAALALQKRLLFLVLGLIVLVSTFNVASTLVVLVRERMRDLGALAALGLGPRSFAAVFLLCGGFLGLVGTAAGILGGSLVCWVLTRWELIRFDSDVAAVYFLSSVPFRLDLGDLAAISGLALALTLAVCLLPAIRAARIEPGDALRA